MTDPTPTPTHAPPDELGIRQLLRDELARNPRGGDERWMRCVCDDCVAKVASKLRDAAQRMGAEDGVRQSPYRCPVCNGQGTVSRPPGVAGDAPTWVSSSIEHYPCRACGGTGVLWSPASVGSGERIGLPADAQPPSGGEVPAATAPPDLAALLAEADAIQAASTRLREWAVERMAGDPKAYQERQGFMWNHQMK